MMNYYYGLVHILFSTKSIELSLDMLYSGVLLGSSKLATQHGDGLSLISFWKNSIGPYHTNRKVHI